MPVPEMTNWHILSLLFCLTKHFCPPSLSFISLFLFPPPTTTTRSLFPVTGLLESLSLRHTADVRHSPSPFFPLNPFFSLLLSFLFSSLSFSLFHPLFTWKRGSVVALCLLGRPVRFWSVGCLFVLFHSGHNRAVECQRVRVQSSLAPQCPCVYNGSHNLVIWFARSQ